MEYLCFLAINAARDTDWANEMMAMIGMSDIYLSAPLNVGMLGYGNLG